MRGSSCLSFLRCILVSFRLETNLTSWTEFLTNEDDQHVERQLALLTNKK